MSEVYWGVPITVSVQPTNPINTDVSTADTIAKMRSIVHDSINLPVIQSVVNTCLYASGTSTPSSREIARCIFWWIKSHVTFVSDEQVLADYFGYQDPAQELLITPQVLLSMPTPMGDCDDFSMLAASLLLAAQIPTSFITIAVDRNEPNRFSHVYLMAYLCDEDRWIPFDCSHGSQLGWQYSGEIYRQEIWSI